MIGLAIALLVAGAILLFAGISALRDSSSSTMPLLFRPLFQAVSKEMGTALILFGAVAVVAAIVVGVGALS